MLSWWIRCRFSSESIRRRKRLISRSVDSFSRSESAPPATVCLCWVSILASFSISRSISRASTSLRVAISSRPDRSSLTSWTPLISSMVSSGSGFFEKSRLTRSNRLTVGSF